MPILGKKEQNIYLIYLRSRKELVHEDSKRPKVYRPVVTLIEDDFRGDILWSAAECPCLPPSVNVLGEAKVHHFYVTLLI